MATMKKKSNTTKGQRSISSSFGGIGKENIRKADNKKEADGGMGLDSNLRKPATQKAKELARPKKKNPQCTINGGTAEGRCDEGMKVCSCYEKLKVNPNFKSWGHDPTCTKNAFYNKTNGGRITKVQYYLDKAEEERLKNLNRLPSGKEICTSSMTQDDVDTFFTPRTNDNDDTKKKNYSAADILSHYEMDKLIARINDRMKEPTATMRRGESVPMVISAAIQSLLDLIPIRFKKGTNDLMANEKKSITYKRLQAYRKIFPAGTIGFTFPKSNKSKPPDRYYIQLEGRTIYFVCWELNIEGWQPVCYNCGHRMIHDEYDFQSHGFFTPIFQITGITDYAVSMYYKCSNKECGNKCKANDGRLLINVPLQCCNGYPVDPRYAVNREIHLGKSFSRVMDKMFITHGNGDQLSIMLNELRGDHYLDCEEEYYCQAIDSGVNIATSLPEGSTQEGYRYRPSRRWQRAATRICDSQSTDDAMTEWSKVLNVYCSPSWVTLVTHTPRACPIIK